MAFSVNGAITVSGEVQRNKPILIFHGGDVTSLSTDADGNYSLTLPKAKYGDTIYITIPEKDEYTEMYVVLEEKETEFNITT